MEPFVAELLAIGEETTDESDSQLFFMALQRMISDGLFGAFENDPDSSEGFGRLCGFVIQVVELLFPQILNFVLGCVEKIKAKTTSYIDANTGCFPRTQLRFHDSTENSTKGNKPVQ